MALLEKDENINKVLFVTVEHSDEGLSPEMSHLSKLTHLPLRFDNYPPTAIDKAKFVGKVPKQLAKLAAEWNIHVMDSKASIAGLLAHKVSKLTGIPYIVESFEPHSQYMLECDVWRSWSPFFRYNKYYEKKQIWDAKFLVTVTQNYRTDLIAMGVEPGRVIVIPSITEMNKFKIDDEKRKEIRQREQISEEAIVGVYVGKFGGLYLEEEAFEMMAQTREYFKGKFRLIILTPQDPEFIKKRLRAHGFENNEMIVRLAPHHEVPHYLAASDFAFSPIRYTPVKAYQSPVKNGEYWACGLPMLLTDKVSDDFWIIKKYGIGGALYDIEKKNFGDALVSLSKEMARPNHKQEIRNLAHKYRSIDIAEKVYKQIFDPKLYL